jgi:C-methyltransferase
MGWKLMSLSYLAGMGWISRSLAVAARLGIADHLADGPKSAEDLAKLTEADPEAMRYLLDALGVMGVFQLGEDGLFRNSESSEALRTDHPESMRYYCILGGEMYYDAWGELLHTVRTGEPASKAKFGSSIYAHMDADAEAGDVYDRAMADLARPVARELAKDYDFTGRRKIVDIGGGSGQLLRGVLAAYPDAEGLCTDRADVAERAAAEHAAAASEDDVEKRLSFAAADFFEEVPAGGDAYVLKNVLHNWSPDSSVKILHTVRAAMTATRETGTDPVLLVVEPLAEHDNVAAIRSLFQMVICEEGTRPRPEAEMREQLETAGFTVRSVRQLATKHSVVEAVLA